ncbi:MAG: hypothetical protein Q9227_001532 [Pyrenula ochraceoflavens]
MALKTSARLLATAILSATLISALAVRSAHPSSAVSTAFHPGPTPDYKDYKAACGNAGNGAPGPGWCVVSASFFGNLQGDNIFMAFNGQCELDPASKKSIGPSIASSPDRSISEKGMPYSFDVGIIELNGQGFKWAYGAMTNNTVTWDPMYNGKGAKQIPVPPKDGGKEYYYYTTNDKSCKAPGTQREGTCYSVFFVCDEKAAGGQTKSPPKWSAFDDGLPLWALPTLPTGSPKPRPAR